jgi:hypothetical protein
MKRTLHLSSFEVAPAEAVSLRLIEGPSRSRGLPRRRKAKRPSGAVWAKIGLWFWRGVLKQTQPWDRRTGGRRGQPVESEVLELNRAVRILIERQGRNLVGKRIVLRTSSASRFGLPLEGALS